LSDESKKRLLTNPLRILDSKDPRDIEASAGIPASNDSLSEKSREHLGRVLNLLGQMGVPHTVDHTLVRGFDYYTDTLWEVTAAGLGAQNALGGGGRYDNLVETLGGRPTPGVGFGSGLERLLIALEAQEANLPDPRQPLVWLAVHGETARGKAWELLFKLREAGIPADMDLSGRSLKAQFKIADREAARYCIVIGDDEVAEEKVTLKELATGNQSKIGDEEIVTHLGKIMASGDMPT
jgi:histidyl-tRNA synthetase